MLRFFVGNMDGKALDLNSNELLVLEAVGYCTYLKDANGHPRGWYKSMEELAKALPPKISKATVVRAVDKLINQGLIERRENDSLVLVQNEPTAVQNEPTMAQNEPISVQNEPKFIPLNNPPIRNNIEQKEENESRTPSRDEVQTFIMEPTFNIFWAAFHPPKNLSYNRPQCRWLWEEILPYSVRQQIISELYALEAAGKQTEQRNAYFYLTQFAPKVPHDWNKDPTIDRATTARLISAKYEDHYGSFTPEHILYFRLEVAPGYKTRWDAYLSYADSDRDKKPPKYKST